MAPSSQDLEPPGNPGRFNPSKRALNHPPAPDDGKARLVGPSLHDFQDDVGLVLGPAHEATSIAAIDVRVLDKWKASPRALQNALGSVSVLDVCPVHLNGQQASIRVD